jgi:ADP-heptose:LPS heptosyltransferase
MLMSPDFPPGSPLQHFFAWNEGRLRTDRRYRIARDPAAAEPLRALLAAAVGNPDIAAHAAVFAAFEEPEPPARRPRRILVIRLSAFGDFIQALGAFAAIRRRHAADRITLLTTGIFSGFAAQLGYFDDVLVDDRPGPLALGGWLRLRRRLRQGRFDRVYDLQTSQRSGVYAWLLRPNLPQWSGTAWGCSHPHANRGRDHQHTIDKQAEQLLMAGIHPVPLPALPPFDRALPAELATRDFVLLVPGSSARHPEKRWPVERFAALARALDQAGYTPAVVGTASEAPLASAIRRLCPAAVDLVGRTDFVLLAVLAQQAALTVGNDSGVCHLAAAADCPVVVLFAAGTDPERCAPRGRLVRVLAEPDLSALPTETVVAEAAAILRAPKAAA